MPISPLANPRPSTRATITEAPEAEVAEEQVVAAKKKERKKSELETQPETGLHPLKERWYP